MRLLVDLSPFNSVHERCGHVRIDDLYRVWLSNYRERRAQASAPVNTHVVTQYQWNLLAPSGLHAGDLAYLQEQRHCSWPGVDLHADRQAGSLKMGLEEQNQLLLAQPVDQSLPARSNKLGCE